jgi:hypothetical protein
MSEYLEELPSRIVGALYETELDWMDLTQELAGMVDELTSENKPIPQWLKEAVIEFDSLRNKFLSMGESLKNNMTTDLGPIEPKLGPRGRNDES